MSFRALTRFMFKSAEEGCFAYVMLDSGGEDHDNLVKLGYNKMLDD